MVGAIAGAGAGLSFLQAGEQNDQISKQQRAAQVAAAQSTGQVAKQAALEREKARQEAAQVRGRLRVAGASAGDASGGSIAQLQHIAARNAQLRLEIINSNAESSTARIGSSLDAQISALEGRALSPILAGVQGGLQGLQAGLAIQSAFGPSGQTTTPDDRGIVPPEDRE